MQANEPHVSRESIDPAVIAGGCSGLAIMIAAVGLGGALTFSEWGIVAAGVTILLLFLFGLACFAGAVACVREARRMRSSGPGSRIDDLEIPFSLTDRSRASGAARRALHRGTPRDYAE